MPPKGGKQKGFFVCRKYGGPTAKGIFCRKECKAFYWDIGFTFFLKYGVKPFRGCFAANEIKGGKCRKWIAERKTWMIYWNDIKGNMNKL